MLETLPMLLEVLREVEAHSRAVWTLVRSEVRRHMRSFVVSELGGFGAHEVASRLVTLKTGCRALRCRGRIVTTE